MHSPLLVAGSLLHQALSQTLDELQICKNQIDSISDLICGQAHRSEAVI